MIARNSILHRAVLAWAPALLLALAPAAVSAQPGTQPGQTGNPAGTPQAPVQVTPGLVPGQIPFLTVDSDPPGAVVVLRGPYEWVGRTPWRINRDVSGTYRVEAHLPGYESWSGEMTFGPGAVQNVRIRLSHRTTMKAVLRSMVIPGWGQAYTGQSGKSAVFLVSEFAALGGLVWTHELYRTRVDRLADAETALAGAKYGDFERMQGAYDLAARRADRAYNRRQAVFGALIGVHALATLDALLFHPTGHVTVSDLDPSGDSSGPAASAAPASPGQGFFTDLDPAGNLSAGFTWRW